MAAILDLANIQGDILIALPKKTERFFFFQIAQVDAFRSNLGRLIPLITTSADAQNDRSRIRNFKVQSRLKATAGDGEAANPGTLPVAGVNIAFSAKGIQKIGINDSLGDDLFANGMEADAQSLGDRSFSGDAFKADWDAAFLQQKIDGVILVTGESRDTIDRKLEEIKHILQSTVVEIVTLVGDIRPGDQAGHEHFGYLDGISQPAIRGVNSNPNPGQIEVDQGVVLLGRGSDTGRPAWALDGSFLAFRKLPQLVPEFDKFLVENAKGQVGDTFAHDRLGARLVGRWKSGAPIQLAPLQDDPILGADTPRRNDFRFTRGSQEVCPFAAHIRKMVPRNDIADEDVIRRHMILRRGIPFGPEVTPEERQANTTQNERGLYFVSYQSRLDQGFSFLQRAWSNEVNFPPTNQPAGQVETPGFDPIIGQQTGGGIRTMTGAFSNDTRAPLTLNAQWVNSKGGEYFFSPSIPALRDVFATA